MKNKNKSLHDVDTKKVGKKTVVTLPKTVSAQDFLDWLNNEPNKKPLKFIKKEQNEK